MLPTLAVACSGGTFAVLGPQAGAWPLILSAAGHIPAPAASAEIFVAPAGTPAAADWQTKVKNGSALILEGASPLAASFGFRARLDTVSVIHLTDVHNPALPVIWSKAVEMPQTDIPPAARVFAQDRWTSAPIVAGYRLGAGAVLWVGTTPGQNGYERFPYLMQSLADLGFEPSIRSSRLWAFFDYSYRARADTDYLAERWRKAGISALHVASWHFYDVNAERDDYLKKLVEACHRHGILVYAWVELPHVSEKFWADHPKWREQTATLQDAQLDWRKLMNLQNPECTAAIRTGLKQMMDRFDWDGVNLAELYFESLEGAGNPARFTPMNADVRAQFQAEAGWDPIAIWAKRNDAASLRQFLDFRAGLVRRMQGEWLSAVESMKPGLDIVLTHVDDRFDTGMKDSIGADAASALPLLDRHAFSFLIEDPATVWNLGPQRYPEIAKRYLPLTTHTEKLAIDINIVDRYQDVYPTRQQTGTELFELVHLASTAFPRVALYFENSILPPDVAMLAASSAVVTRYSTEGRRLSVDSPQGVELVWT
ncbi:MAG: family 10 glycosylhydrolase, partial [Acidobacteriota bacterium]|nr:family 10 glycosylhydrolase [Acidobacteriota bacterium]